MRRTHYKIEANGTVKCPKCGEMIRPHRVCPACGNYKGKEVIKKRGAKLTAPLNHNLIIISVLIP